MLRQAHDEAPGVQSAAFHEDLSARLGGNSTWPQRPKQHALLGGADFILVGMFDWQIAENAKLAQRVINLTMQPGSKRTRPWHG